MCAYWIINGFLVEIGGLEWMGVVHGGIIVDTLLRVLDHSSLPLRIHMDGMGSFLVYVGWNVKWNRDMSYNSAFINTTLLKTIRSSKLSCYPMILTENIKFIRLVFTSMSNRKILIFL